MHGFIYIENAKRAKADTPARFAPVDTGQLFSHEEFERAEYLWAWGGPRGDVYFATQNEHSFVVLSGYILEIQYIPSFSDQREAARFLLQSLDSDSGPDGLPGLLGDAHGSFGIFYRDMKRGITLCATDRVGSRPLWTFHQGDEICISTHVSSIAAAMGVVHLDKATLGSVLLYGGPIDPEKSMFEGITGVPSGSVWRYGTDGGVTINQWYQFRHDPSNLLTMRDWVKLGAERLTTAAGRILHTNGNPAIFFSGGTDSRLTAAAIKAAGGNPLLVTLGDTRNLEVKVAQLAARALKARHEVLFRDAHWYLRGLKRAVFESAGSFVWTHAHFSQAAEIVSRHHANEVFMLGDLCEAFSKLCCSVDASSHGPWSAGEFAKVFDSLLLPLYRPADRKTTLSLLKREVREEVVSTLKSTLMTRYERLKCATADQLIFVDFFLRWQTLPTIATFFMFLDLRSAVAERNLMVDKDVHAMLEILPSAFRNQANLGARLVAELAPQAAWVPNANSLLPLCMPPAAHRLSKRCKPVLGKVRRYLLGNPYTTTGSWPNRSVLYAADGLWRSSFDEILSHWDWFDEDLFDVDATKRLWKTFISGDYQRAGDVEKMALIGLLNRMLQTGVNGFLGEALDPLTPTTV